MGVKDMNGDRKTWTGRQTIMIGGVGIPLVTLVAFIAWGVHKVDAIDTNTADIVIIKTEGKEHKKEAAETRRDVDKVLIEQRHMMDDIKVMHKDWKDDRKEMKDLLRAVIRSNGSH